ncbi:hypothetical protein [Luminiphilus syltensis]|uniref:hypothetical protein n=1 Tax=Luminiphilus syltensis TaxID=1341119 RepID=UPI0002E2A8E6|nr:hypothetical protein [Luminiphilus syltensis]
MELATLVLQSAPAEPPEWVTGCLTSVNEWCNAVGYERLLIGDELFDILPGWFRQKTAERLPMAADLARLLHIQRLLESGVYRVIWADADTLVLNPRWQIEDRFHTAFGQEHWLQHNTAGRWAIHRQPHNAFCLFRSDSPVLDFLIYAATSIVRRADADHLAPQMIGPKLLKALHNLVDFDLLPEAGAISPDLLMACHTSDTSALAVYRKYYDGPLYLANLCQSLAGDSETLGALETAVRQPETLATLGAADSCG